MSQKMLRPTSEQSSSYSSKFVTHVGRTVRFVSRPAEALSFTRMYTRLYTDVVCTPVHTPLLHERAHVHTPSRIPNASSLVGGKISVAYRSTLYILNHGVFDKRPVCTGIAEVGWA